MNTQEIEAMLRERFAPPEYALIFNVRNGTGFARSVERTADAIAMSLYPSRGLHLIGYEIKAHRSDWLRELKDPDKADAIARYCDRWYLVIGDKDIVKAGELPPAWGLIEPHGNKLRVTKEAPELTPKQIDRLMLAALLRAATTYSPSEEMMKARIEAAVKAARNERVNQYEMDMKHLKQSRDEALKAIEEFENVSGLRISSWNAGSVGEAVKMLTQGGIRHLESSFAHLLDKAEFIRTSCVQALETIKKT